MYQRSLKNMEAILGDEHPYVAKTHIQIARIYDNQGKHGDALAAYEKSLGIETKLYGTEHQSVKETRERISEIKALFAQTGFAFPLFFASMDILCVCV